jgi:ATP-binding cassette, subfamily C (CFTR/MRP), member 4
VVGCRVIKCYGWELHYIEKIKQIRQKQVGYVIRLNLVSSLGNSIFSNMGLLAVFVILYSEWNKARLLSNEDAVTVLAMVYFVFFAINTILYMGLTNVFNFLAIMQRMSTVMGLSDVQINRDTSQPSEKSEVRVEQASFSWSKQPTEMLKPGITSVLNGISFQLKPGDFLAIVGQVGSGKTTLLYSLMSETFIECGKMAVTGTIAYVEQEPLIISGSIKENILMGKVFDAELFAKAVSVAQLDRDIKLFHKGAETIVGERGISISGGQRARISLARAVYSEADIFLLDDPLSAVDPEVAQNIFDHCIRKHLSSKIVILVTH